MISEIATKAPLVTVLIPTYNDTEYLAAAIEGVLGQTFTDFELIILDNASTDNTQEVLAKFTDPRIRKILNETNIGFLGSVQKGAQLARGEFVVDIGSDDIWEPKMIEKAVAFFEEHPQISFLHTAATWIDEKANPIGVITVPWRQITPGTEAFVEVFKYGFCLSGMFMRKKLIDEVGMIDPFWGVMLDLWWFLKFSLRGDVGYINEPLVRFRLHGRSLSAGLYVKGKGFREHVARTQSAFEWPDAKAAGITEADRKAGLYYLVAESVEQMHAMRDTGGRGELISAFLGLTRAAPAIALRPRTWMRFGFALMPRSLLLSARAWKRKKNNQALTSARS